MDEITIKLRGCEVRAEGVVMEIEREGDEMVVRFKVYREGDGDE